MSTESKVARPSSTVGFTLPELIVGVLVFGLAAFMVLGVLLAVRRNLPGRDARVGDETLAIAPSPAVFGEAVRLHGQLLQRLTTARAVYVFGGTHRGLPEGASRLGGKPLALSALPTLDLSAPAALTTDAWGFYQAHQAELGRMVENPNPDDFTVVVVGPLGARLAATAVVQVRTVTVDAGTEGDPERFTRREATLYDASGDVFDYVYVERPDVSRVAAVGASHFWHRYAEARVAEEGPVLAVFPDPSLYAGARGGESSGEIPPFSRFAYVMAVNP